jgi:hypothetical protein
VKGERRLTHKMRIQFGDDEFVFFDETASAAEEDAAAGEESGVGAGRWTAGRLIGVLGIGVLVAAAILALLRMYYS